MKSSTTLIFILVLKILVWGINSQLVDIDITKFNEQVLQSDPIYVVEYYSSRCGSCVEFSPIYDKMAKKLGNKIKVGKVSIDDADGMALAGRLGVLDKGIPAVRAYLVVGDADGVEIVSGDVMAEDEFIKEIENKVQVGIWNNNIYNKIQSIHTEL